jgi:hypothetical protein
MDMGADRIEGLSIAQRSSKMSWCRNPVAYSADTASAMTTTNAIACHRVHKVFEKLNLMPHWLTALTSAAQSA